MKRAQDGKIVGHPRRALSCRAAVKLVKINVGTRAGGAPERATAEIATLL